MRTPALDGAPYMTEHGPDMTASIAGTHVIEHAGRLLALREADFPFELTPELDTVGAYDADGCIVLEGPSVDREGFQLLVLDVRQLNPPPPGVIGSGHTDDSRTPRRRSDHPHERCRAE
ncbi:MULTISPECIES: carotenoid oxygenase family protein [unclassified Streptomyces]|uniref:carotenoid oxygenase family protein n=1 Tax=unclassified Streptomyces TaxID=2593676 RepID=UPI00386E378B